MIGDHHGLQIAVIGATGNVGREMLNILAEREFPADEVFAIASRKSMGVEVSVRRPPPEMPGPRAIPISAASTSL